MDETTEELAVLQRIISSLTPLDNDTRFRILQAAATFLKIEHPVNVSKQAGSHGTSTELSHFNSPLPFSGRPDASPKEFLLEKEPKTDIERVACLAFYLTHYRNTPHFKTLDISKLNTEAAQIKFSNAAVAVDNATRRGFLVPGTKGNKQLGALGERYVQALPDREAAKAVLERMRGAGRENDLKASRFCIT